MLEGRVTVGSASAHRFFGHGPKRQRRLLVADAGQRIQARRRERGLFDRRVRILLEVAQEPTGRDPRMPRRIFPRDQHSQFEGVGEAELRATVSSSGRQLRSASREKTDTDGQGHDRGDPAAQ